MKSGQLTLVEFFGFIDAYAANNDREYYKNVLTGVIPLDSADEGLDPVGAEVSIDDIYTFFSGVIDEYEVQTARKFSSTALDRKH